MKLTTDILRLLADLNITVGLAYGLNMRGRVTDEMMRYAVYSGSAELYFYLVENGFDFSKASDETVEAVFASGATAYAHPFCAGLAARVAAVSDRNRLARLALLADAGVAVVSDIDVSVSFTENRLSDERLLGAAFDRSEPVALFLVSRWRWQDGLLARFRRLAIRYNRKAVFLYLLDFEGAACLSDLISYQRWGWLNDYLDRVVTPSVDEQSEALMVCIREGAQYLQFAIARGLAPFNTRHIAQLLVGGAFEMAWDIIRCHPHCRTLDWEYIMYETHGNYYDFTTLFDWVKAHGLETDEELIRKYRSYE